MFAWCRVDGEVDQRCSWTLFEEPYWLDAVAPGAWDAVEIRRDGRAVGRLPYAMKRRYGLKAISLPRFTPWLGPWIRSSGGKLPNELSHQHQILETLLKGLPKTCRTLISCAPEFQNLMAFHWGGFDLGFAYTYRLSNLGDEQHLWSNLRDTVRRLCRKAEKVTVINREPNLGKFIAVMEKTFVRQGMEMSETFRVLERIDETMSRRNQRTIYSAEDAHRRVHAAAYVVYDDRHAFYLAGGSDPALRESGAHALALWHAVKDTSGRSQIFDFEGSMNRSIEYFVRGFGSKQVPRFLARRSVPAVRLFELLAGSRSRF
jgi:hypothetical protein